MIGTSDLFLHLLGLDHIAPLVSDRSISELTTVVTMVMMIRISDTCTYMYWMTERGPCQEFLPNGSLKVTYRGFHLNLKFAQCLMLS